MLYPPIGYRHLIPWRTTGGLEGDLRPLLVSPLVVSSPVPRTSTKKARDLTLRALPARSREEVEENSEAGIKVSDTSLVNRDARACELKR
jgi:hypothetical protein